MLSHNDLAILLRDSKPFLRIRSAGGSRWLRNVPETDGRRGPWLRATYDVLDGAAWDRRAAGLYLVIASDGRLRYIGISKNRIRDRWRTSPAIDASTGTALPDRQLFHSQSWRHMEAELLGTPGMTYEVRVLFAQELRKACGASGTILSEICESATTDEELVALAEGTILAHADKDVASWNRAGRDH